MGKSKELATLTDAGGSFSGNLSIDTGATDTSYLGGGALNIVSSTNTQNGATLQLTKKSADKQNYMSFDQDILFLGTDANSTDHANIGGKAGVDLRLFAGGSTRMTIDASGRVTMPYQPFITGEVGVGVRGGSGIADRMIVKSSEGMSFSNSRVTVPVTGTYLLSWQTIRNYQAAGRYDSFIKVNGLNVSSALNDASSTIDDYGHRCHIIVLKLYANDYVQFEHNRFYALGSSSFESWDVASVTLLR